MDFNKLIESLIQPVLFSAGFVMKQSIKGIVEYERGHLAIIMSYDYNSSYEVDATLLFKESGLSYGYKELKEYFYSIKKDAFAIQIVDEDTLKKWLNGVSEFLKEQLNTIIHDHKEVQIGLERIRQYEIDRYEEELHNRRLREGVDKYWLGKDYSGLVKFLKSYKNELEGSIKKKYEYALKRISEQ